MQIATEIESTHRGTNSLDGAEDRISDLEDKVEENTPSEQRRDKGIQKEYEDGLGGLRDDVTCTTIRITGTAEEREQELKTYLKK